MPGRDEVRKVLPELDRISDEDLREKTLDVWIDAMEQGGWDVSDLDEIPFTLLIDTGVSFLEHTRSVTRTAIAIAETMKEFYGARMPIDMDRLVSGGILHDVGKLLEYRREGGKFTKSDLGKDLRHPFSGTALAFKHGIPSEVCHLIAVHAKEGEGARRMPEAQIIHHADFANFESLKTLL
ncbi:MAG: HD domain-containing protein [Candidatus Eisenbacteria bacterium]|nr:HD domain-containing protein [Candidatus Eisenbacteria bacterium]